VRETLLCDERERETGREREVGRGRERERDLLLECMDFATSHGKGGVGMYALARDCLSLSPSYEERGRGLGVIGWSLQTLWNQEIAILLVPRDRQRDSERDRERERESDRERERETERGYGEYRMYIRSESETVLQCLLADLERVLYALSGGFLALDCDYDDACL
jgi:hypothetical protein